MNSNPNNLEIEVKFHLADPAAMHQRLLELGAEAQPKVFETNIRYDDNDQSLLRSGRLLRLRQDSVCRLTFKSKPAEQDTDYKIYNELEVEVQDFDTMNAILRALGYDTAQIYEKWRQSFAYNDAIVCMDSMPYGEFLEIEGPKGAIREIARRLGLPWQERILSNYLAIFDRLRHKAGLPFNDVTFNNFKRHPFEITPHIQLLQAGQGGHESSG